MWWFLLFEDAFFFERFFFSLALCYGRSSLLGKLERVICIAMFFVLVLCSFFVLGLVVITHSTGNNNQLSFFRHRVDWALFYTTLIVHLIHFGGIMIPTVATCSVDSPVH